jgi:hypothetical protein
MIFLKQNEKQPYCKLDAGHTSLADAAKNISSCKQIVCEKINNFRASNINRFELDEITNATGLLIANVICNLKKRGKNTNLIKQLYVSSSPYISHI